MPRLQKELLDRAFRFALGCIDASDDFPKTPAGWHIGKQLVRAGTSVRANLREADVAFSRSAFAYKVNLSRSEVGEAQDWLSFALAKQWPARIDLHALRHEGREIENILATI